MNFKQKIVRKNLIKLLKKSKKQFYDDDGKEITTEEFADKLLSMNMADALALQKEIKRKKDEENEQDNK